MSSRKDTSGRESLPDWSQAGVCYLLIRDRSLAFLALCPGSSLSAGLFRICRWEHCKTSIWTNGANSACYLTPGSVAKLLRRCDPDDGWLRTRVSSGELILVHVFPFQARGQAMALHSLFPVKSFPHLVLFFKAPLMKFLILNCINRACYFWTFVVHQKYGILSLNWMRVKGKVW